MLRRPVFSVVDQLFKEGHWLPHTQVFCLSNQARNELLMLSCLFPCLATDLRASYHPDLYALDASPFAGAVCASEIGSSASAELGRFGELRGYHTRLQSEVSALLSEKGIDHEGDKMFGAASTVPEELQVRPSLDFRIPKPSAEGVLFDAIELFRGSGNWSSSLSQAGLRVHDGYDVWPALAFRRPD